ncbi:hypothetical protein NDU88_000961 [Pleurodeles waltl]|uniref:Uncharacterized protein n=1 Tax=Pleurodeles waltl TaxID=8319 RepID=A0AAV7SXX2_PLEWA|nr:hypothetical protein NDU88_000961 [Pleurodeles waltl]
MEDCPGSDATPRRGLPACGCRQSSPRDPYEWKLVRWSRLQFSVSHVEDRQARATRLHVGAFGHRTAQRLLGGGDRALLWFLKGTGTRLKALFPRKLFS